MENYVVYDFKCLHTLTYRENLSRIAKNYNRDKKLICAADKRIDGIRMAILNHVPPDKYKGTHRHDEEDLLIVKMRTSYTRRSVKPE